MIPTPMSKFNCYWITGLLDYWIKLLDYWITNTNTNTNTDTNINTNTDKLING